MATATLPTIGHTNYSDIQQGDLMAFTYWCRVDAKSLGSHPAVSVEDVDTGNKFKVTGLELVEAGRSADRYSSTESVSKAKAAQVLTEAFNRPFSVTFLKKDGSRRKLRGRLLSSEHLMGRSMVADLDKDGDVRQIDHRTIENIIVDGVKYITK